MRKVLYLILPILMICYIILEVGCARSSIKAPSLSQDNIPVGHIDDSLQNTQKTSLNLENSQQDMNSNIQVDDRSTLVASGPEIVDNLKSIVIENLNDENNSKVTLNLSEGWYAKKLINDKAPDFEFNAEKNRQIKKAYSFEIYDSMKMDKYKQFVLSDFAGWFEMPSYYRDQSERSRFPNHCQVKSRVYAGDTILGQGEVFILNCDIPDVLKTDQYSTYDMIYAWIPINDEALAYNLSISVPLGEKDDGYIEMVKKMLNADSNDT